MEEKMREELLEVFNLFDADRGGSISKNELLAVFAKIGLHATSEEVDDMLAEVDTDGDGEIGQDEFLRMLSNRMTDINHTDEIKKAFKVFDKDGSGSISAAELAHVLTALGDSDSLADVERMIKAADFDKDGVVNYSDFVIMMTGEPPAAGDTDVTATTSIMNLNQLAKQQ